ncbi:hypothetical protein H9X85_00095 [Anaerotignum lactatifermentans]|uniref:N-acetyltransferase domain-containing protein n=1 Tax=Anaerotignum lactatifermentans TaxID=160404 RepID=A0ABS2G6Z5_9FIRM|nr:hypothetical protein [Anaerotignum lactatifermentans]MBM6828027.1 hypothetical protein [Anaerotignum lactatifermentans]MBM6876810.1 hypothetical protein [Anaerotignum lactatifermentans]MBM6949610.1 hypothetical protein [Anaerotignum lactatifermentans]
MILLTIQEESGFAGFFVLAVCQDLMLVDYFAVAAGKRDRGIGSQALGLLRRRCPGKKIFLEIETEDASAENAAQRKKRKLFYLRNGMKETGICWRLFGVEMEILSFSDLSREESARMYAFLYGRFWFLPIRPV